MRQIVWLAASLISFNLWANQVEIFNATVREPLPGKTLSAGYFSIKNSGTTAVTLVSVSSSLFGKIELHTHHLVNGLMTMAQIDSIVVEPGQQIHLQPGGLHLMLFRPAEKIHLGQKIPLQLQWSDGAKQMIEATVTRIPKQ